MYKVEKKDPQSILAFACMDCPFMYAGRCDGPQNAQNYLMENPSGFTCINVARREEGFKDVYDRIVPTQSTFYQEKIVLPPFIPGVKSGLNLINAENIPIFAVSLGDITSNKGAVLFDSVKEIIKSFRLPSTAKVVLIGTAKDAKLQALWKHSDILKLWRHISKMGFEWVTGFSFSIWDEQARFDQILCQDKNLLTCEYFAQLGVPSIPFVYPYDDSDYKAFGNWMNANKSVNKIAVYARFYLSDLHFSQFIKNMRKLQKYLNRPLEFLVISAGTPNKIRRAMSEFNASILNWKPFHKARSGRMCASNLIYEKNEIVTHDELAVINFQKTFKFCNNVKNFRETKKILKRKEMFYEIPRKMELSTVL